MPAGRSERVISAVVALALIIVLFFTTASGRNRLDEEQALQVLLSRIEDDRLYKWADDSCLALSIEKPGKRYVEFAIRQKHGDGCSVSGGAAAIIDRFRVSRLTKRVQWYEPTDGDWLPYSALKRTRTTSGRPSAS